MHEAPTLFDVPPKRKRLKLETVTSGIDQHTNEELRLFRYPYKSQDRDAATAFARSYIGQPVSNGEVTYTIINTCYAPQSPAGAGILFFTSRQLSESENEPHAS